MSDEPVIQEEKKEEEVTKEQYLRLAADFENYKKMIERQLADAIKFANQSVVLAMIEVMDHFDQVIAHAPESTRASTEWYQGLEQTGKSFHEAMRQYGVERIETEGKQFDPTVMEAVSQMSEGPPDKVCSEIRAGYKMHERVIRPARVIIYK
ncbi:MAG: Protein GrpE [Candidatus Curtissbacteria bacterium GW2011_GWA1_40_16]|uniref:Protein GrpE n=1 Tax=Candidatus Curtissbacteria bacterium GW2011_GWA1_40_16 TaxID=1618405 RepID=A0A0G0TR13_9BACT|nr:MAG: Protein GrpE [Candidatus Curtissbacteria bacterium GW2011_GWA1_40_16]